MAENLLTPDGAPGGTTAAENLTGRATPGAGHLDGDPVTGGDTPGNPAATDPGATGQIPTTGKAVPDAGTMENDNTIGDNESMDDGSGLQGGGFQGNQGAQPPTPGDTNEDIGPGPTIREAGNGTSDNGGVPTGGLSGTGTIGGVPTGAAGSGMGDEGR